jgi:tryptophanyl-tRNA synthetase
MMDGKKIVLTGDRPTGKLHLGHLAGSLQNRVKLQNEHKQYVMIADVQALTDNAADPLKVRNNVLEVAIDNLAAGVDPAKTTMFIQSMIPELAELTIYFLNLVTLARAERNPTVKNEMRQKGYGADVPMGFLAYPISQAADILGFKADIVPAGEDQLPMIEQTNEIAHKFNTLYGEVFGKVEALMPEAGAKRVRGIDGQEKMGKSLGNAIYLADSSQTVEEKIMLMYTDPQHVRAEDPGHVEGNVVFEYLDLFDADKGGLEELKKRYSAGGVGDIEVKKRLIGVLESVLGPIREKREYLATKPEYVIGILKSGTEIARGVAAKTLSEVKKAMQLNYF